MTGPEHVYTISAEWTGNTGTGTSSYREYSRDLTVRASGKPDILGSADVPFRGDPARWNPEELLLAALAQCHMLSYLYVVTTVGVVVTDYRDEALGTMVEDGRAGGEFTQVMLRPVVTVADASMVDAARTAHKRASELCFIARSMNFPVLHEPEIRVAS
jgi:organic hydroperoxide reductase OsmC/OhrA